MSLKLSTPSGGLNDFLGTSRWHHNAWDVSVAGIFSIHQLQGNITWSLNGLQRNRTQWGQERVRIVDPILQSEVTAQNVQVLEEPWRLFISDPSYKESNCPQVSWPSKEDQREWEVDRKSLGPRKRLTVKIHQIFTWWLHTAHPPSHPPNIYGLWHNQKDQRLHCGSGNRVRKNKVALGNTRKARYVFLPKRAHENPEPIS